MIVQYEIADLVPYINWPYFYFAWQLKQKEEQERMQHEAEDFMASFREQYKIQALFRLFDAYSDGDDIVVTRGEEPETQRERIACLRQQETGSKFLCLADFIAPNNTPRNTHRSSLNSKIGLFATSADSRLEKDFSHDPYQKMMAQLLADRLAEAAAERIHEEVRKKYWGYAPDEQLSVAELHMEHFQGIRPAVGYPSLPDTSLNFVLDRLLNFQQIGIRLTESGAMRPHASVSGMMIAHPKAHYFSIGKIGEDQLSDYARRRGLPLEITRKFLSANL